MKCIYKNNPGNIRFSKQTHWKGQIGQKNGFCLFENMAYGIRAMAYLLMISYRRAHCDSIASIINRYAPPKDHNNTESYINFVSGNMAVRRDFRPMCFDDYAEMIVHMTHFEQGEAPDFDKEDVIKIMDNFSLFIAKGK